MKRSLSAFFLASLFALPAFSAAAAQVTKNDKSHAAKPVNAHAKAKSKKPPTAPADEYFGRQKYSILGIRNALHDLNIRYDGTEGRVPSLYHDATSIEDAMHDWDKKYHGDLWLAHYMFQLDQIYMRVPPNIGHDKVEGMSKWIIGVYPNTYFGKYLVNIRKLRDQKAKEAAEAAAKAAVPAPVGPIILDPTAGMAMPKAVPSPSPVAAPTAMSMPSSLPMATIAPTATP